MKLNKLFSKYESMLYLLVKLFIFFIVLWMIMFIIPSLFIFLFDSYIGNLVLLGLIILTGIYSLRFAIGFAIIITILYRFNYLSRYQILHL